MKKTLTYILASMILCLLHSCVLDEAYEPTTDDLPAGPITFTATPKGYVQKPVTKAEGAFDDSAVHNAYFLLFDGNTATTDDNRKLRVCKPAQVTDNTVEYSIGEELKDCDISDAIVCFLANVSKNFVEGNLIEGTTTWETFKNINMPITYASVANTGTVGVPTIDIETDGKTTSVFALPMFNWQKINTNDNEILLERLFARVELHLSLGIEDNNNLNTALSQPQFGLVQCDFCNIPKMVPVVSQDKSTEYSEVPEEAIENKFLKETLSLYNQNFNGNKMLYYSELNAPQYKSFYIYVPEHKLGDCGDNNNPHMKPDLINGTNKRPVYASINGYLVDGEGNSYEVTYNVYFGENSSDNFDLSRNTIYKNYVRINGVKNGPDIDHRVVLLEIQEDIVEQISKKGQAANCYIISQTGTYMLPAYKGAYSSINKAPMCDVGTNEVLACDNPNIEIIIDEAKSKQSTIVFKVESGSLLSGNAVIARRNLDGDIEWSWHLWFIPGIEWGNNDSDDLGATNRIGGLVNETMPDGETTLANRNLGVTGSITNVEGLIQGTQTGFYYRYGYHNPYFEDKVNGKGSDYHGLKVEDYTTWNSPDGSKSVTDPCPPGYRVPPATIWEGDNDKNATKTHYSSGSGAFRYWDRGDNSILGGDALGINDIYYPYSGYLDAIGNMQSGEKEDENLTLLKANDYIDFTKNNIRTNEILSNEKEETLVGGLIKYVTQTLEYTEYEFFDFEYEVRLKTINIGYLWESNASVFMYANKANNNWKDFNITKCKQRTRKVTRQRQRFYELVNKGTWYNPDYKWELQEDWREITSPTPSEWSAEKTLTSELTDVVISNNQTGTINNEVWRNELKSNQSDRSFTSSGTINTEQKNGYQVRCVAE